MLKLAAALTAATEASGNNKFGNLRKPDQNQLVVIQNRLLADYKLKPSDVYSYVPDSDLILSGA